MAAEPSDERASNLFRQEYRPLSEEEKLQMKELKDRGDEFVRSLRLLMRGRNVTSDTQLPYEILQARIRVEEAVMWAVKFLTSER